MLQRIKSMKQLVMRSIHTERPNLLPKVYSAFLWNNSHSKRKFTLIESEIFLWSLGPVYNKYQCQCCDDACNKLSLKTIESSQNGLQPHSQVTPLWSMRACCKRLRSIDANADAWCKWALTAILLEQHIKFILTHLEVTSLLCSLSFSVNEPLAVTMDT